MMFWLQNAFAGVSVQTIPRYQLQQLSNISTHTDTTLRGLLCNRIHVMGTVCRHDSALTVVQYLLNCHVPVAGYSFWGDMPPAAQQVFVVQGCVKPPQVQQICVHTYFKSV